MEYEGYVVVEPFACGPGCDGIRSFILLNDGTKIYPFQQSTMLNYDDQYIKFSKTETTNIEFEELGETKEFDYVICVEPQNTESCSCNLSSNPVCGINGKTYLNECLANCASMQIVRDGECSEQTCDNPLDLEIVQYAINNGCTELIYSFNYEGIDYININIDCEGNGIIYNCSENSVCMYNEDENGISNGSLITNCGLTVDAIIENPPTENNIIWSKGCNLETTGTIDYQNFYCGPACTGLILFLRLEDDKEIYPSDYFALAFHWELGYEEMSITYAQTPNLFFIDQNGIPLVPLSYIICTEPLDECYPCDNELYEPVCGRDGNTYDNECFASCNGVQVDRGGKCDATPPAVGAFNCE